MTSLVAGLDSTTLDGGALWHMVPLGICVFDPDLVVHGWNRQLESWTGLASADVVGCRLTEIFPDFALARFGGRICAVFQSGMPTVLSATLHQEFLPIRNGNSPDAPSMIQETRILRLSANPPRAVATLADMTHSMRQQQLLRHDRAQLLKTQQALESANASLQESLALSAANNEKLLAEIHERRQVEADLRRQTTEYIATKARESKHRQHLEQLVRDLTIARYSAESAARAKSEFLANMSHEIRTPMTAILGYIDMLQDPDVAAELRREAKESIHQNGEHLMEIINDMLDISQIEADKMTVEPVALPVRDTAESVVEMMRPRAAQQGLALDMRMVEPLPPTFVCDPVRFRQILVNLVGNAIKFTPQGTVNISVKWLEPFTARGRLAFTVADTGIGMPDEVLRELFQPFVQADSRMTRKFGGTGLGLAISQRLAKLLGGEIQVTSTLGVGSTFTVEFPCPGEPAPRIFPQPGSETKAAAPQPNGALGGMKILVVDDAADNRKLLCFHLQKAGAVYETAENGQEALEKIANAADHPFDVVLMDMQMPVLDGYAATAQLRQRGDQTPVIAVTAHAMAGDREKCLQAGCSDYLTKPIQRDVLVSTTVHWHQKSLALAAQ
ncbi:MAG: ATP-binding protein [Planctomycetaceae bacterium]|nr:ATP-binding protein [Planctomycetaceae bacterium]